MIENYDFSRARRYTDEKTIILGKKAFIYIV